MSLDLRVLRKLRPRKHRPQTPEKLRPLGVSKTKTPRKTQTPGCLENSYPPKNSDPWVSRKISRQTPLNTQSPGCLENSDPQYFSNITTNYSHRAASLSFATTEANGFAEISPERKFALAKSRQNQIFDLEQSSLVQQVNDSTAAEGTIYWTKRLLCNSSYNSSNKQ